MKENEKMRLDINDPNHWHEKYSGTKVWLDGSLQSKCNAFDSDEGWVETAVLDEKGCIQVDSELIDEIWIKRNYGKVTYQLPDGVV